MVERNEGRNIFWPQPPSLGLFEAVDAQKSATGIWKVETTIPFVFQIDFPDLRPVCSEKEIGLEFIQSTSETISGLSDVNFLRHSPNSPHAQTMAFLVANWEFVLCQLSLRSDHLPLFCYPEVKFGSQKYHNPDIVGYGGNGSLIVVEIGKKGTGKNVQLRKNLENLRLRFPAFNYLGLTAYYCQNIDPQSIKVTMNYLKA